MLETGLGLVQRGVRHSRGVRSMRMAGRHFLQIPGPTNVPDRILRAMDMPIIDYRSAKFGVLGRRALDGLKTTFRCSGPVFIYPASGTGAWEAALVSTLSPGDQVLMVETGHLATLWKTWRRRGSAWSRREDWAGDRRRAASAGRRLACGGGRRRQGTTGRSGVTGRLDRREAGRRENMGGLS
jgi:hypothetical protein